MPNPKDNVPSLQNPWIDLATNTAIIVYVYAFLEWLFFATKPSFLTTLEPLEKVSLVPLSTAPFLVLSLAAILLCFAASFASGRDNWKRLCLRIACLGPAIILGTLLFILIDNFCYTVVGFGVQTVVGQERSLVLLLYGGLLFLCFRWLVGLTARRADRKEVLKQGWAARAWKMVLASLLLAVTGLALVAEGLGRWRGVTSPQGQEASRKPNIILIGADGVKASHLSAYAYSRLTSPRLASFGQDSIVFENAFVNSAHTGSSLASILSGKLPTTTKLIYPPDILQGTDSHQHLPGLLRQIGYQGLMVSMRHYADPYDLNIRGGFNFANSRSMGQVPTRVAAFIGFSAAYFVEVMVDRVTSRLFHLVGYRAMSDAYAEVTRPSESPTLRDEKRVEEFLGLISAVEEPFLAQVHLFGTHGPRFRPRQKQFSKEIEQNRDWMIDPYDDAIRDFDLYFGEILDSLKERDLYDQSMIIVYSDHGLGFRTYERVPLLIRLPTGAPGRVSRNVQNLDIAPTILDYLGVDIPDWMEGQSLLSSEEYSPGPIFSVRRKQQVVQVGKRWQMDSSLLEPPFYSLGILSMVQCHQYFTLSLDSWRILRGDVEGHSQPCDKTLATAAARELLLSHLSSAGYLDNPPDAQGRMPFLFRPAHLIDILDWGPQVADQGAGFNIQPNGVSEFWIKTDGRANGVKVFLDEQELSTLTSEGLVTAAVHPEVVSQLTKEAGIHRLTLAQPQARRMRDIGFFIVQGDEHFQVDGLPEIVFEPRLFTDDVLRSVGDWGPQSTEVGNPFNVQPNGNSAMWIKGEGDESELTVYLDTSRLTSSVESELVTAQIEDPGMLAEVRTYKVYLVDLQNRLKQLVGEFEVQKTPEVEPDPLEGLQFDQLTEGKLCEIIDWGPQSTIQGVPFNPQPDGSSAFWIRVQTEDDDLTVFLDGAPLRTSVAPGFISAAIDAETVGALPQGMHRLMLVSPSKRLRQAVADFAVLGKLSTDLSSFSHGLLCEISKWGPQTALPGLPFNLQPDGQSAFWIETGAESCQVVVFLESLQLDTSLRTGLISAAVPANLDQLKSPGSLNLYLVNLENHQKQLVGRLEIR